ncbi:hypothetical protein ACRAWF_06135 [Streptomyces sp. L7]
MVRAEDLNNTPPNDPIGTLVLGSDARNISAGVRRRQSRAVAKGRSSMWTCPPRTEVDASRDHVLNTPVA